MGIIFLVKVLACFSMYTSMLFAVNWVREVSPTLGCSIEILLDIYVSVGMSVESKMRRRDNVAHAHARSHFWAVKTDQ